MLSTAASSEEIGGASAVAPLIDGQRRQRLLELVGQRRLIGAELAQDRDGDAVGVVEQRGEQVFGLDLRVAAGLRDAHRAGEGLLGLGW